MTLFVKGQVIWTMCPECRNPTLIETAYFQRKCPNCGNIFVWNDIEKKWEKR